MLGHLCLLSRNAFAYVVRGLRSEQIEVATRALFKCGGAPIYQTGGLARCYTGVTRELAMNTLKATRVVRRSKCAHERLLWRMLPRW